MSKNDLLVVSGKLVLTLEEFKNKLPSVPTEDLVDGYTVVKDLDKKISTVTSAIRDEFLANRFFKESVETDEKGNRYLEGHTKKLKAERRISKPTLLQDEAIEFFAKKKLLDDVVEVSTTVSGKDFQDIIDRLPNKVSKALKDNCNYYVSVDKVSALVALGRITVSEAESLFTEPGEVFALKTMDKED